MFGGYMARWMETQGASPEEARETAALVSPAVLGLVQGYVLQHEVKTGITLKQYAAAIDALLNGALATRIPR